MENYILDTNLFFNMEAGFNMGEKTEEVVRRVTEIAKNLRKSKRAEFYMPPRAMDEFLSFFEEKNQPFIKEFISTLTIKAPDVGKFEFPAHVFYQLIDDIRQRNYRGLRAGEEEIQNAGTLMAGKKDLEKKDFEIQIGTNIKKFRERYRRATRFGFLDSLADLDLILLSKEQNGFLVSGDEGVIKWGNMFGVKSIPVSVWEKRIEDLMSHLPHQG